MNKNKAIITGCLFSSLFASAWYLNEKIKRDYVEPNVYQEEKIQLTNFEESVEKMTEEMNVFEKFKPREYVRVVTR